MTTLALHVAAFLIAGLFALVWCVAVQRPPRL